MVSGFYSAFLKAFPNWETLAAATVKDLERWLRPWASGKGVLSP